MGIACTCTHTPCAEEAKTFVKMKDLDDKWFLFIGKDRDGKMVRKMPVSCDGIKVSSQNSSAR